MREKWAYNQTFNDNSVSERTVCMDTIDQCYYVTDCMYVCVAWGNLANVLNADGRSMEAEQAYKAALRHRSNMADVHYNLYVSVSSSLTHQIFR